MAEYTSLELRALWYLKGKGGAVESAPHTRSTIMTDMCKAIGISRPALRTALASLENRSIILRTYWREKADTFGPDGYNPILKIELVDPDMELPQLPAFPVAILRKSQKQLPLGVVMEQENEQLLARTNSEPTIQDVCIALLEQNEKLRANVAKLQDIIEAQAKQLEKVQDEKRAHQIPSHLTNRIRDALPPEKWAELNGR